MLEYRIIRRRRLILLFSICLLTLTGCQWGEQLYVAYDTKLEIDASVNTATSSGSIDLGYDRRFVAWVPRSVELERAADRQGELEPQAKLEPQRRSCRFSLARSFESGSSTSTITTNH